VLRKYGSYFIFSYSPRNKSLKNYDKYSTLLRCSMIRNKNPIGRCNKTIGVPLLPNKWNSIVVDWWNTSPRLNTTTIFYFYKSMFSSLVDQCYYFYEIFKFFYSSHMQRGWETRSKVRNFKFIIKLICKGSGKQDQKIGWKINLLLLATCSYLLEI